MSVEEEEGLLKTLFSGEKTIGQVSGEEFVLKKLKQNNSPLYHKCLAMLWEREEYGLLARMSLVDLSYEQQVFLSKCKDLGEMELNHFKDMELTSELLNNLFPRWSFNFTWDVVLKNRDRFDPVLRSKMIECLDFNPYEAHSKAAFVFSGIDKEMLKKGEENIFARAFMSVGGYQLRRTAVGRLVRDLTSFRVAGAARELFDGLERYGLWESVLKQKAITDAQIMQMIGFNTIGGGSDWFWDDLVKAGLTSKIASYLSSFVPKVSDRTMISGQTAEGARRAWLKDWIDTYNKREGIFPKEAARELIKLSLELNEKIPDLLIENIYNSEDCRKWMIDKGVGFLKLSITKEEQKWMIVEKYLGLKVRLESVRETGIS